MRIPLLIITQAFLAVVSSPLVHAQQGNSDSATKIEFSCASWDSMKDELFFQSNPSSRKPEFTQIDLSVMMRSRPYELKASGFIPFYIKDQPTAGGEPSYSLVAKAKLPTNCKRVTFIFQKNHEGKILIRSIPDDRKHSPFGAYQFFNLTKLNIKGALADKR